MSTNPIYFQWQNDILLKTIYPLREMKLRDFLVFYQEIDLWAAYKDKSLEDLKDEVKAYRDAQTRLWSEAYDLTQQFKEEFIKPSAPEDYRRQYPELDEELHRRSNLLFNTFKTYFPRIKSVENERYFLTQRIGEWEITRKWVVKKIERLQRDLNNMPANWVHRPQREKTLGALEKNSLPMADEVLDKMYSFLSATVKVEKRRVELKRWKNQKSRDKTTIDRQRGQLVKEAQALEKQHQDAAEALRRLKNPPDINALEAYFIDPDITNKVLAEFGEVEKTLVDKANQVHRNIASFFKTVSNESSRANYVRGQLNQIDLLRRQTESRIEQLQRDLRNMPPTWSKRPEREQELQKLSAMTIGMIRSELGKLDDYINALASRSKSQAELTRLASQKEAEFEKLDSRLRDLRQEASKLENEMKLLDLKIGQPEKEQLLTFLEAQQVTVNDLVNGKIEQYRRGLENKDQYELLEMIIQRFHKEPTRYPLWLQYMVIHFSGMRYQSAHGSWADPKDLLLALRMKDIEQEVKHADDAAIEALCAEKLALYQPGPGQASSRNIGTSPTTVKPKLAQSQDKHWKSKLEYLMRRLDSASPYTRRKALLDLRIDEEDYEIEGMTDQEALESLEEIKDDLPEWMWKEIVKLTQLRLTEVKDKNWETLTPEEQEERYAYQWREYRQILDDWKRQNLTGWREEHDRANKLIVTRAVCNEVAEHIQHLRGHSPPGGLTAKPEWYLRNAKDPKLASGSEKPFLIKPKLAGDFKPGGSVLWLRFVHGEPNQWRIARPVLVRGEGLLSPGLIGGGGGRPNNPNAPGSWSYSQDDRSFRRSRSTTDARGQRIREEQWLRWIHEATVAEVAETAEGPVVLTFETALPYEDKRQSTIGVFKHHLDYIRHQVNANQFIASFVGYVPQGDLPMNDLRDMLDWNKILLKDYVSGSEMQAYRDQAGILSMRALGPRQPTVVSTWLEATPPLRCENHTEEIACYLVDPEQKTAVKYEPEVLLRRGTVMKVSVSDLVKIGDETYYPVSECQANPLAVDLYVQKGESIDLRQEKEPLFVTAGGEQQLYELKGADASGRPQFQPVDIRLLEDTRLRISTMHLLSEADPGDGTVTDGKHTYVLILECFSRSSINGLFLRADGLVPETS